MNIIDITKDQDEIVRKIAKQYYGANKHHLRNYEEGLIIDRFYVYKLRFWDPAKGYKFSQFVKLAIKSIITEMKRDVVSKAKQYERMIQDPCRGANTMEIKSKDVNYDSTFIRFTQPDIYGDDPKLDEFLGSLSKILYNQTKWGLAIARYIREGQWEYLQELVSEKLEMLGMPEEDIEKLDWGMLFSGIKSYKKRKKAKASLNKQKRNK